MNTLLDLLKSRYSLRLYDAGKKLSPEVLGKILEAAHWAPSAVNRQPWKFTVFQSEESLKVIQQVYPRPWFTRAPCVVVVSGNRSEAWVRPSDGWNSLETDLALVMDHLTLAATALGVGSCWISNFDYEKLRGILGLAHGEEVFALTPLGYPGENDLPPASRERKSLKELIDYR